MYLLINHVNELVKHWNEDDEYVTAQFDTVEEAKEFAVDEADWLIVQFVGYT